VEDRQLNILLVEDDQVDQMAFQRFVRNEKLPYLCAYAGSVAEAHEALASRAFDAVVLDYMLGDGTAFDLFDRVPEGVPIIVVTGGGGEEIAVQAMKAGASDYLTKHPDGRHLKVLPITLRNAIKSRTAERALKEAHEELERRVEERTAELWELNAQLIEEIHERRKAEEKYRSIFENAVEGIFQSTPGGRFISANPAMARIYGFDSPQELIEKVRDIGHQLWVSSDLREEFLGFMRKGREIRGFEVEVSRHGGARIWVSIDARPVLDNDGNLLLLEGIVQDITERRIAEEALRESEERYRSLVEHIDIGVTLMGMDYTIVMTNAARARMYGKAPAEFVGKQCFSAFRQRESPCVECAGTRALSTSHSAEMETETELNDGARIDVRIRAFPVFGKNGEVKGFIEVAEDITDRVRIEEQLRQASKMEAVGSLAGGVAHDFNNLLTTIMGYSHLLLQQMVPDDPNRSKVAQILRGAERSAGLTRQLLAFSRKQALEVSQLDLNDVVADLGPMLQSLIGEDVQLRTVPERPLGKVMADPGQIEQVLMNLAVNARDAMPEGGTLTMETKMAVLDEEYRRTHPEVIPGPYVMLAVTDTGCGMAPQTLSRIFEPFFTTKEKGKGTGLGLSMVYGIVKQHQGHISVYSEPEHGTTFKLFWPTVGETAQEETSKPAQRAHYRGEETILLVEDEDIVRELTWEILEMLGYTVLKASEPSEAIDMCERYHGPIHLLLTDVVMPHMHGNMLFQRLSPLRPDMKVLYISGYTENSIVHHGVLQSAVNFLPKPFTVDGLASKVRSVLDAVNAHTAMTDST